MAVTPLPQLLRLHLPPFSSQMLLPVVYPPLQTPKWGLSSDFTVYGFSALISAFGRSGLYEEAIGVFNSMKNYGLRPNLVTYNAVIDACGKGGMEFKKVAKFFDEMQRNGVQPDRITFNSLLAVISRGGLWEAARNLFDEMLNRRIEQDVFSYNTLLDAICKGGQTDLAFDILAKKIMPNVVSYSTVIDGFAKVGRFDEALNLFDKRRYISVLHWIEFRTIHCFRYILNLVDLKKLWILIVVGDGALRRAVEALLRGMDAPFPPLKMQHGTVHIKRFGRSNLASRISHTQALDPP